ncbi:MAG: DUF5362 family protein, partial [Candidatus Ratteibacteria bacterium]|nr:DUF5362 family protein [Candidatus Ratteibacteria bacterium]
RHDVSKDSGVVLMAIGGTELLTGAGLLILLFIVLVIGLIVFPTLRKIIGFIFIVLGILLSLTIVGAVIGIPMIIEGAILYFTGNKKETVSGQHQQQTVNINAQTPTTKVQIRCSKCRQLNEEYAAFCQKCGTKL